MDRVENLKRKIRKDIYFKILLHCLKYNNFNLAVHLIQHNYCITVILGKQFDEINLNILRQRIDITLFHFTLIARELKA